MDTIDRSDSNLPARFPSEPFRAPVPVSVLPRELANGAPSQISPRLILRGLNRHWWRILMLWLVVSGPLAYLIYELVKPAYEAYSLLQVEPATERLFTNSGNAFTDIRTAQPYLQTQVELIRSDTVLDAALSTDPRISNLPMIKASKDPKAELRKEMTVEIVRDNTFLIRVALASPDANEAAAIVNAVVDAYLLQHSDYHLSSNKSLKKSLEEELSTLDKKIGAKRVELQSLVENGHVAPMNNSPKLNSKALNEDDPGIQTALSSVTQVQYTQATDSLLGTELDLIEAKAELGAAQGQLAKAREAEQQSVPAADQVEARIEEEFKKDPDTAALIGEIKEARDVLADAERIAVQPGDPARARAGLHLKTLRTEYEKLWADQYDGLKQRLLTGGGIELSLEDQWKAKVGELQVRIDMLQQKRISLAARIESLKTETKEMNSDTLNAAMVQQELASLGRMQEQISVRLAQLSFESKREPYRITNQRAGVPRAPFSNKRLKLMAAAWVGILFLMLGLFLLLEIKAERVADPDALSSRVQSEVYALPPLPTARSIRKRSALEADDQIEQFVQRLDHLRFAVCGNPAELEKGRCVLITSATGREGKTTLAAQLAARCGNAGMSTLLIDADLRRTGLCTLLDVPEGPGLSDALENDEPAPTDLVIPVQGGTFHLLPAGTPTPDASRALQNRKLGLLITQFRQIYDLIIIDSPPVLPVPDALILGRWADGAVLAVRYDTSRFPQVERARRQLDSAGINVLGTVINGMRNSNAYYGSYSYNRRSTPQPDPTAAR